MVVCRIFCVDTILCVVKSKFSRWRLVGLQQPVRLGDEARPRTGGDQVLPRQPRQPIRGEGGRLHREGRR